MTDGTAPRRYDAKENEARWQAVWEERGTFVVAPDPARPKYYVLEMFPYPSGRIHMGHVRNYTMGDVVARYKRARGFNVLHPMGWDAFGMPAENAAMEQGVHPGSWTYENIAAMRSQLRSMGLSIDWSRELATCHPGYYRHQQAMFLDFLESGLLYRASGWVNWDPVDRTVLANEQVIDGCGWRSGAPVEKREMPQWFLRITDYAEDLRAALAGLERWPDKVRTMQENWIGRSEGLRLTFPMVGREGGLDIYTTRHDTIFGSSFCAVSPEHPLAAEIAGDDPEIAGFVEECRRTGTSEAAIEQAEKRGVDTGLRVRHPFRPDWTLPVYVANFILMEYGTGAIFGCPAHDQRDLDFARKYGLPVLPVVVPEDEDPAAFAVGDEAYLGDGRLANSDFIDGLTVEEAKEAIARRAEADCSGRREVNYRLRRLGRVAPAVLGLPDPGGPLRGVRKTCAGAARGIAGGAARRHRLRDAGQPARPPPDLEARLLPRLRRRGGARDLDARHLRRFVVVFRALLLAPRRRAGGRGGGRILAAGRSVYRRGRARDPAPALCALLHPGDDRP